nr:hypothetical protein [Sphingomonas sp. S2M10]
MRAAARAIYDSCYAGEDGTAFRFDEAESFRTARYLQAVGAAQQARTILNERARQLTLFAQQTRA